jgi:hypothetical protein
MGSTTYEFRIDGQLSEAAREAFCDMRIDEQSGRATLYGEVIDESHLLGILAQFGVLGLVVVSAHPVGARTIRPRKSVESETTEPRRPPLWGRPAGPSEAGDQVAGHVSDGG